ncbi:MAG TPA: SDR family oxidoreductase, partial [Acidimicrobiales bacterium]|nr:SDR family oxidoreductase [Acidimicrobiales bacterium]
RAYTHLLAARGASVVVNDLGASMEGDGADARPAQEVVDEITAAGGRAVADTSDVATESGARALVTTALEQLGRIDVVVSNAGIIRWARFPDVSTDDLDRHLAVHVAGAFLVTRAAWPHLVDQGYGRIVLTTSTGLLGLPGNTAYGIAKGGVLGLARSLALAGRKHGVRVNCIAPAASTRMAGEGGPDLPPEQVAPMVAYLAHEDCPVTGEVLTAGGGRFARLFIGATPGYLHDGPAPTVEDVAAHWPEVIDEAGSTVPPDLLAWSAEFLSHLTPDDEA